MTIRLGVEPGGVPLDTSLLAAWAADVGVNPTIVGWFTDFTATDGPSSAQLGPIQSSGATNMIAWNAEDTNLQSDGVTDTTTSLSTIIAGNWDFIFTNWGQALAAWGLPIMLRFLPEMNGNWTPWCEGVNGNTHGQFVQAWQHAYNIMAPLCPNVEWIWNVNIQLPVQYSTLASLYPGDAYVDWIGLDGYNFGGWSTAWLMPQTLFNPTLALVQAFTSKPIMICETGCSEDTTGNKAAWITQLFQWLKTTPIQAVCWFNFDARPAQPNWTVQSSPPTQTAFNVAVQGLNPPPF
jgi:beta-mannanase